MRESDEGGGGIVHFSARRFAVDKTTGKSAGNFPFQPHASRYGVVRAGGKIDLFQSGTGQLFLLEEAESMIEQLNTSATGTIRIGASDTIFEYFLADKIVEYHEKFPGVKIELLSDISRARWKDSKATSATSASSIFPSR